MIANYAELVNAVAVVTHRTDLASVVPVFLGIAEQKINRRLRVRQMEVALNAVPFTGFELLLPTGWLETRELRNADAQQSPISTKPSEFVRSNDRTGQARFVAVEGQRWRFDAATGSVSGSYYAAVPALGTTAPTNWLLTENHDLYLFGLLAELAIYERDNEMAALWAQRSEGLITELNSTDMAMRFSGSLEL